MIAFFLDSVYLFIQYIGILENMLICFFECDIQTDVISLRYNNAKVEMEDREASGNLLQ